MIEKKTAPEPAQEWPVQRLRFSIISNPVRSEVADRPEDDLVSFVPMEAVGEFGELNATQERQIADVYTGYTYFAEGDVVVAKITPCFENGKGAVATGLCNGVGFGTTELHVLRAGPNISNRWLYYVTASEPFRSIGESEMLGAGGQKRVPEDFIKDFRVGVPGFEEQERIADFLDKKTGQIDALIVKKRVLIERLKEKRLAVITQAVTKGLNPGVAMRDSGVPWIGKLPRHWTLKRMRFVCSRIEQGWSPQCENQPADEDAWGVMRVGCVNGDTFDPLENKALPVGVEPIAEFEIRANDILISRANTKELLGSAALVPNGIRPKLILCDKLFRLKQDQEFNASFLVNYLRTPVARFQYEREATGASGSMQNIGQDTIKNVVVPVPPESEQVAISEFLKQQTARMDQLLGSAENAILRLSEYRSALITDAVAGKLNAHQLATPAIA